MSENKQYENEYKVQAVKLAKKDRGGKSSEWTSDTRKYAVRLDQKSKDRKPWYRLRRTQPGRISEYRRRKPAAEEADQSIGKRKQAAKRNKWVFAKWMSFWRMQRLFSLPAVRDRERTKIDVYCDPDRWRQKHQKDQFLLQHAASQQTGVLRLSWA